MSGDRRRWGHCTERPCPQDPRDGMRTKGARRSRGDTLAMVLAAAAIVLLLALAAWSHLT